MMTQVLGHYQLEELIGSGGMGQVWRARDLALGRDCALKILPAEFPGPLRDRLLREARTGARLQHPGIATFYEAGEIDGQAWISMELVRATTLRKRLQQGPLSVEDALSQAACLLDALGHAHAVGILHRDIKPENIMVVGDRSVKLLDFGLAKELVQQPEDDRTVTLLTEQGKVVGTIGYMSPEQLRGEKLDERSDLFSVGAVLYEAISGKPAFPGKTPTERMAHILAKDPEPLVGDGMVSQINAVVQKALAKDRGQRYASVGEFMIDLTLSASGELRISLPNSLVVMDFDNISGHPDDQWIGIGVAESITAELTGTEGIEVTARSRLQKAQTELASGHKTVDRQQLGLTLGCRWMVSGGFQKMGNALRFTVQLTELLTDREVLSEKVDGKADDIFDMQDQLAGLIRQRLASSSAKTPARPEPQTASKQKPEFSAWECYVKGRAAWLRGGKADLTEAGELFQQAIEVDPDYALAWAGLATVHALRFTYTTEQTLISLTKENALRALELDPGLAEAHVWLGYAYINEYNIPAGFKHQLLAVDCDPKTTMAHYFAGGCLIATNSSTQAETLFQQIHPADSIDDPHRWRFKEAVRCYQQANQLTSDHCWSWLGAGAAHLALNEFRESEICLTRAFESDASITQLPGVEGYLCETLRRAGRLDEARTWALKGIEAMENADNFYRDTMRAVILSSLGRTAFEQGDSVAASVAFNQAVQHLEGRNRARGGGHPYVQALCGLAQANRDAASFEKALDIYRNPGTWSFHFLYLCTADITLCALARAAVAVGNTELARQLKQEAMDYGSLEAATIELDD